MKTVKELYARLNATKNFKDRYPNYEPGDCKVHILFLSPCLNECGYFRMILPALELNKTETHSAIISHIQRWDFTKQFDDYDTPVDFRLIQWAHYVVLPSLFSDLGYIVDSMRELNSEVEFVMDIDLNYHQLPKEHPDYTRIQASEQMLLDNLKKIDILTAPNTAILKEYNALAFKDSDEFNLYFENYGNLLSEETFTGLNLKAKAATGGVRIGLILETCQAEDLKSVIDPLIDLLTKFPETVELVIFGWSQKLGDKWPAFKGLPVRFEKPVLFTHYYEKLQELQLDLGIVPLAPNEFNGSGKALNRYLDFAALEIPTVVYNTSPFRKVIQDGLNGFIAGTTTEWMTKIEKLILDPSLRAAIGNAAQKLAWERFSYNARGLKRLTSIFI